MRYGHILFFITLILNNSFFYIGCKVTLFFITHCKRKMNFLKKNYKVRVYRTCTNLSSFGLLFSSLMYFLLIESTGSTHTSHQRTHPSHDGHSFLSATHKRRCRFDDSLASLPTRSALPTES